MIYTQQMTEETSVFLTEKRFILNKWRKFDFLLQFHGKNEVSKSGQSDTEGTMINQPQSELKFDPSIVVLLLVSIEWNDGSAKKSKTGPHSNYWVCLFWVFERQHKNFSLYGDVNSTAEELQIFWTLMF